jgi:hypothetical protein
MQKKIIYTNILKDCEVYAEERNGVLYVLLKEELKEDKIKTDLIVSEIIRRLAK